MKTGKLEKLFLEKYPEGFLQKRNNKIEVFFGSGKTYSYTGSNYSIGEKLDLIPELYNMKENTNKAIKQLEKNGVAKIKAVIIDTLKSKWSKNHNSILESKKEKQKTDQYGRSYSSIKVEAINPKNNPWNCTKN